MEPLEKEMKNHRAKTTMCREYNDQYSKREKKDKEREEKRMKRLHILD